MDNHIALNFFLDSQREIYSIANMSCCPHASTTGKVGQCDQVKRKPLGSLKQTQDGFWDMFSLSEFQNLGPLALRPVARTNHPLVSKDCLCCSWLIYFTRGSLMFCVAIVKSQEPTTHLATKNQMKTDSQSNYTLPSLNTLLTRISKNSAMGKTWMSKINAPWLDCVSLGQKKESLAGGH